MSIHEKVAIVTGSSKGIGKEIAFRLGKQGVNVVFNFARDDAKAENTFHEYVQLGYQGLLVKADVSSAVGVEYLVSETLKKYNSIHILIPNATPDQPQHPISDYSWEHYERMLQFFVKSPYYLCKAVLPIMKAQKWGRIVNITSEVFEKGVADFTAYVAAKGGQVGFSRSLANEVICDGITVNMVSPGWIPSERHENIPPQVKEDYLKTIPAGRWGIAADIAHAVSFFCQQESDFITGQTLVVNGGGNW